MKDCKMHLKWSWVALETKGHPISNGLLESRMVLPKNLWLNGMEIAVVDKEMKKYRVQGSCRQSLKKGQCCGFTKDQHVPFTKWWHIVSWSQRVWCCDSQQMVGMFDKPLRAISHIAWEDDLKDLTFNTITSRECFILITIVIKAAKAKSELSSLFYINCSQNK